MSFFLLLSCNVSTDNQAQSQQNNKTEIISSNENDSIVIAEIKFLLFF